MSSRYFLDGGINNGDSVFIYLNFNTGTNDGYIPYLLIRQSSLSGTSYLASSTTIDSTGQNDNNYLPTFVIEVEEYQTSSNNTMRYKLRDTTLSYLTVDGNGYLSNTRVVGGTAAIFESRQTKYQPWRSPTAFLAGVECTFTSENKGIDINIYKDNGKLNTSNCSLYVVPVNWFQQGFCSKYADQTMGLVYNYCYLSNNSIDNYCKNVPYGWTKQSDCELSLPYNYCQPGVNCSAQCMGPCVKSSEACNWNQNRQAFQCDFSFAETFTDHWWKSMWVIITLAVVAGICLILLIFIPIIKSRNKDHVVGETFYEEGRGEEKIVAIT